MTAVIEMSSRLQWKHDLLGRKTHSDERFDRMQSSVSVPEWKREIILRKNNILETNYPPERFSSSSSNDSTSKSHVSSPRTRMRTSACSDIFPDDNYFESSDNDPLNSSQRVIADHLESVHDNPFFRAQGRTFVHKDEKEFENNTCIGKGDENNIEDVEEYSPFSGIVNKLCKKFNILGAEAPQSQKLDTSKRSASLQNLLDTHHCYRREVRFFSTGENDECRLNTKEKNLSKLSVVTRSTDYLNHMSSVQRPCDDKQLRFRRGLDVEYRHSYVAPDLKMGRDKIEIIDLPPLSKQKKINSVVRNETKTSKDTSREENDMPKPNTVSNFRSMFEPAQSTFQVDTNVARSLSPVSSPLIATTLSQNGVLTSPSKFVNEKGIAGNARTLPSKSLISEFEQTSDNSIPATTGTDILTDFSKSDRDRNVEEWTHTTETVYFKKTAPENSLDEKHSQSVATDSCLFNGEMKHQSDSEPSHSHIDDNIRPFSELKSNFESSVAKLQDEKEKNSYSSHRENDVSSHSPTPAQNHWAESSIEQENRKLLFDSDAISSPPTIKKKIDSRFVEPTSELVKNKKPLFDSHSIVAKPKPPVAYRSFKSETSKSDTALLSLDNKLPVVPSSETDQHEKSLSLKNKHVFSANISPQNSGLDKETTGNKFSKSSSRLEVVNKSKDSVSVSNLKIEPVKDEKPSPDVRRKKVFDSSLIKPVVDKPPKRVPNMGLPSNTTSAVVNGSVETLSSSLSESKHDWLHQSGDEKSNDSVLDLKQEPVKGIPSIFAQRLNKSSKSGLYVSKECSQELHAKTSVESEGSEGNSLVRPSGLRNKLMNGSLSSSPMIKRKPNASEKQNNSNTTLLVLTDEKTDIPIPQSNIDDIIGVKKKETKPKEIFNSISIAVVKKAPSRKNWKRPADVPPLILPPDDEESPGYIPTKIKPCPYVFIGAPVLLPSQPLQKTKTKKVTISFNDTAICTFEYVAEKTALEDYLTEHPEEREELLKLEALEAAGIRESSDDPEDASKKDVSSLKSTPLLANPEGDLVSYKSKMQVDFQFGMQMEPEPEKYVEPIPEAEEDMHLRPADQDDLSNWSETQSSDMLF